MALTRADWLPNKDDQRQDSCFYAVMRLMRFDALAADLLVGSTHIQGVQMAPAITDDGSPAPKYYLPVFETIEQALEWNEDGKYPVVMLQPKHNHEEAIAPDEG